MPTLHQRIVESCQDALYLFDLDSRKNLYANRSMMELIGWSQDQLAGFGERLMGEILHPDDLAAVHAHWQKLRTSKNGEVLVVRYRMRSPDGVYRWLESREAPFERADDGQVRVILGVATDATPRLEEEERLRRSEERFRLLAENARELICLHEPDGRYRYVSPAVRALLGYEPEALIGTDPRALLPADDELDCGERPPDRVEAEGAQETRRHRLRRADGGYSHFETTLVPLVEDDAVVGWQSVSRDVTAQRQLEERLELAERLELIGQLAAGVAHDFNNVLTAAQMNVEMLARAEDAEDRRALARDAAQALAHAGLLTRRLLAVGRRDRARAEPLELRRATGEVLSLVEGLLHTPVSFTASDEPLWANLDPGALEQVLLNLVINARDAGDAVEIRVSVERVGAHAVIAVQDDGPGIADAIVPRVFEPFFTSKGSGKGTGLGLATVRALVERAGGHVELETEPGVGTTLRCAFPRLEPPPDAEAPERADAPPPLEARTVLVVDDEARVRRALRRILRAAGYLVETAPDGEAALGRLRRGPPPDLLVSDVFMPRLDGPSLVEVARREGVAPPVLFVSGYVPSGPVGERLEALGAPLLGKPFSSTELLREVRARLTAPEPEPEAR